MVESKVAGWLGARAKTGVTDLPSNVGWLLLKAFGEPAEDGSAEKRKKVESPGKRMKEMLRDTSPFVGDSLESRVESAREAIEQAREAEARALDEAQQAKGLAVEAENVTRIGDERIREAKKTRDDAVAETVAEARRRADAMVDRERAQAEAAADRTLHELEQEVEAQRAQAVERAEQAQARARALIDSAEQQVSAAQTRAHEAVAAAEAAAEEAHRQAEQIARAVSADALEEAEAAKDLQREAQTINPVSGSDIDPNGAPSQLRTHTRDELMQLATSMGLETRTSMRKDDLVKSIRRAASAN